MPHRKEQIETALRKAIAQVMERDLQDPRIRGLISITAIELTTDRRQATVEVSVIPQRAEKLSLHGLNAASGFIQAKVSKLVKLRTMPNLRFRLDPSLKKEAAVLEVIRQALADDQRNAALSDEATALDQQRGDDQQEHDPKAIASPPSPASIGPENST
jgi:ribosome-binding factor A